MGPGRPGSRRRPDGSPGRGSLPPGRTLTTPGLRSPARAPCVAPRAASASSSSAAAGPRPGGTAAGSPRRGAASRSKGGRRSGGSSPAPVRPAPAPGSQPDWSPRRLPAAGRDMLIYANDRRRGALAPPLLKGSASRSSQSPAPPRGCSDSAHAPARRIHTGTLAVAARRKALAVRPQTAPGK